MNTPSLGQFNAQQFTPKQAGDAHPAGKFQAQVSNTSIEPVKTNPQHKMYVVEFSTPAGTIPNRYNIWNENKQAVDIAVGELTALCYATGVFLLDFDNQGAAMRGARCMIDVGPQMKDGQPTKYMEIKKVFDTNGNEPGKAATGQMTNAPAQQQQPAQAAAPLQQQPNNGGWGNPTPTASQPTQQAPTAAQPAWGAGAPTGAAAPAANPPWWGTR